MDPPTTFYHISLTNRREAMLLCDFMLNNKSQHRYDGLFRLVFWCLNGLFCLSNGSYDASIEPITHLYHINPNIRREDMRFFSFVLHAKYQHRYDDIFLNRVLCSNGLLCFSSGSSDAQNANYTSKLIPYQFCIT